MFVSSYSTYVNVNNSQKINKKELLKKGENSFSEQLASKPVPKVNIAKHLPVNYISNYKALNTQQKLQQETQQNLEKTKYAKINATTHAKEAYSDNSKIFSFLIKPKATLSQTQSIDKKLPKNIQEIKEKNLRQTMVNTYISNDNYFKITA